MADILNKKVRQVWLKCSINLLLEQSVGFLLIAGIAAAIAILIERMFGFVIISVWTKWVIWAIIALVILITFFWLRSLPTRLQVGILADRKLQFKERFSTALMLAKSEDPFAQAACDEVHKAAEQIKPSKQFPIRPSRRWLYAATVWAGFALLTAYLPQKDLLGFVKRGLEKEQQVKLVEATQKQIEQAAKDVASAVKQLNEDQLDSELAKLAQFPQNLSPDDVKRQTIQKLGDLANKVSEMQNSLQQQSIELMKNMLKQLRGSPEQFAGQLRLELAKGNFGQAANLLEKMQKQIQAGSLSEQQKKELTEQLQNLAKELKQLAENNKQLEEELEKMGLDKSLAKMDKEQLQKALQNKGLSSDKIEQLMEKMAASRQAASRTSALSSALASAGSGGLSGNDLAEALEQLGELDTIEQQARLSQATLDEIERAIACLGEGMCQGIGGLGPFSEGTLYGQGPGSGRPGRGFGPTASDTEGDTSTTSTKVKSDTQQGAVIASWYLKGSNVKGEAKKDFSEVMKSANEKAAEAINENIVPKKYEESVKKYFSQIEQSAGKK